MAETRIETARAIRRYALLCLAIAVPIALVSAGMPGHFLWRWIGVPLILAFLCSGGLLLFHCSRLVWDWMETLGK
jgi:peptidoglycan/LPS O-acetylase OafA/YrhL